MKLKLLLISAMIVLAGCTPSAKQIFPEVLPDGLTDCKFYSITDSNGLTMRIVRCPNSSVSTKWKSGKTEYRLATVDN